MVMLRGNFIIAQITSSYHYLKAKFNIPIQYRHSQRSMKMLYLLYPESSSDWPDGYVCGSGVAGRTSSVASLHWPTLLGRVIIGSTALNKASEVSLSYL